MWAEVETAHLAERLWAVCANRDASRAKGEAGRASVEQRFSWDASAARLLDIVMTLEGRSPARTPPTSAPAPAKTERSPYWLGLRISVVIPTHNRKEKLMACLGALARQSVLPQEFEVIVVDDGSSDGTGEALADRCFPFTLRYFRQEASGPGAARNVGIAQAAAELVLFIGDDILADERLLEEHLLAHAARPDAGVAILGRIDWAPSLRSNAVMDYVCGDAMLQFAYTYIPGAAALDHRFFYTSNISLKRAFLADAAVAGIAFDPSFRRAAFEDSEFALRLMPRGLKIQYADGARAYHDHWMDLASFSARELGAGQMAVVFYRKHPGQDPQLLVRWIADLVEPSSALLAGSDGFLARLEAFDEQTDVLLHSLAGSLEQLLAIEGRPASGPPSTLSAGRLRAALHNVLRTIFDIQRTRGKIQEWFDNVDDPAKARAAQTLASVTRKIEFLNVDAEALGPLATEVLPFDRGAVADLSGRLAAVEGMAALWADRERGAVPQGIKRKLRRLFVNSLLLSRARQADRFIEARFQSWQQQRWLEHYRRLRGRIRDIVWPS